MALFRRSYSLASPGRLAGGQQGNTWTVAPAVGRRLSGRQPCTALCFSCPSLCLPLPLPCPAAPAAADAAAAAHFGPAPRSQPVRPGARGMTDAGVLYTATGASPVSSPMRGLSPNRHPGMPRGASPEARGPAYGPPARALQRQSSSGAMTARRGDMPPRPTGLGQRSRTFRWVGCCHVKRRARGAAEARAAAAAAVTRPHCCLHPPLPPASLQLRAGGPGGRR